MAIAYSAEERRVLDAKARDILDAHPDVGSFIRRGLARDPEAETLVYLRMALDPAPVVTKAREFEGLLNSGRDGCAARASVPAMLSRCWRPTAPRPPLSIGPRCLRLRCSR